MPKTLIIFDADETLSNSKTGALLPGIEAYVKRARSTGTQMAIITNQGGPACRNAGWQWSARFPTLAEIETRYNGLAETLGLPLYMALAYRDSQGGLCLPQGIDRADPRANPSWRLPVGGMIVQAMRDFEVDDRRQVLIVGVRDEARKAARALGVPFIDGRNYFKQKTGGSQRAAVAMAT